MADIVRYQVMPPLSAEEYQELYDDIKANGVLVPILVDEDEVIIDGHHRAKIANELGIPCPEELVSAKSEQEKRSIAFNLNLKRRHLNREQRRALIAESLKADPQLSNNQHAKRTGTSDKTVKSVRESLESTSEIPKSETRLSADGRERPSSQPLRERVEPEPVEPELAVPEQPEPVDEPIGNIITQDDLAELNQPIEKPEPPRMVQLIETDYEPEPEKTPEEIEHERRIERDVERLLRYISGEPTARRMKTHPDRNEILDRLGTVNRNIFLEMEEQTTWQKTKL